MKTTSIFFFSLVLTFLLTLLRIGGYGKGTASGAGGGFYKNNYAMDDYEDDDDMNDYGD
jgi:hypothetical protein